MNNGLYTPLNSRQSGVTLVEVLIVMVIIAILATIAIPSFISMLKRWEANQICNLIINAYRIGKTKSFIHHNNTTVCLADSHLVCHRDAQASLLVFNDKDENRQYNPTRDSLIQNSPLRLNYGKVYLRAGNQRHYIKFSGDTGLPRGHFAHIKYCPDDREVSNMYLVSLNELGQHRVKPYSMVATDCP